MTSTVAVDAPLLDPDVMAAAVIASGGSSEGASERARALAAAAIEAADRQVMDDITDALDDAYTPSGNRGPRVSDVGACRRSVWYREAPPEGFMPDPPQYRRQAALGSIIHEKAAAVRSARYPWRMYEFEVTIPGLDKKGRVDEYDPVLGEVTDDKTVGSRRWEFIGEDGPDESAWAQGFMYGLALEEMGWPIQSIRVIVINRDNGEEEYFRRPYDPAAARRVLDDLIELATMLDLGVVPPRDGTGPASDWRCRACFAMSHCWNTDAAAAAGRLPESYTLLGADPTDETIAWAAERLMVARRAAKEAKAAEDAAKDLLDGVVPGEYGDFTVSLTTRKMPNYKDSFERLLELYALSDVHRPPVAEVEQPLMRIDRYTTVRRKRAAARKAGDR